MAVKDTDGDKREGVGGERGREDMNWEVKVKGWHSAHCLWTIVCCSDDSQQNKCKTAMWSECLCPLKIHKLKS